MTYRIIAVSGGTGDPSNSTALAERILAAAREQLRLGGVDAEVEVIELRPLCLLYTSPSPRDRTRSRMPSSA